MRDSLWLSGDRTGLQVWGLDWFLLLTGKLFSVFSLVFWVRSCQSGCWLDETCCLFPELLLVNSCLLLPHHRRLSVLLLVTRGVAVSFMFSVLCRTYGLAVVYGWCGEVSVHCQPVGGVSSGCVCGVGWIAVRRCNGRHGRWLGVRPQVVGEARWAHVMKLEMPCSQSLIFPDCFIRRYNAFSGFVRCGSASVDPELIKNQNHKKMWNLWKMSLTKTKHWRHFKWPINIRW